MPERSFLLVTVSCLLLSGLLLHILVSSEICKALEGVSIEEDTYLRYEVFRSFDYWYNKWLLRLTGVDDYLVTHVFNESIVVEENLWGTIRWPENYTLKEVLYIDENGEVKIKDSGDSFEFTSSLLFEEGVLEEIGMDGICNIYLKAANPFAGFVVSLNALSTPGDQTCLFLTAIPTIGENISTSYGTFNVTSIETREEFNFREVVVGALDITTEDVTVNCRIEWDVATGVLLQVTYTKNILVYNGTENLSWKLKETNLFKLAPQIDDARRLELNDTHIVDSESLTVDLIRRVTICDIIDRDTIAFQLAQIYEPKDFAAFDLLTGSNLEIELEYQVHFVILRIYFPRTIKEGEIYSFMLHYTFYNKIAQFERWFQVGHNHVCHGIPTYYSISMVFPGDKIVEVDQAFIRKKWGSQILEPKISKTNNETVYALETLYLSGNDEFNIWFNFRDFIFSVDITSIEVPSQIFRDTNQSFVVNIENQGDNCSLLVEPQASDGIWISSSQEIYVEEDKTTLVSFMFNPSRQGGGFLAVNVFKNSQKLDSEIVEIMVDFLSAFIEKMSVPDDVKDLDEQFNLTVHIRNDGTIGSRFAVELTSPDDGLRIENNNQTVYLNAGGSSVLQFPVQALRSGNITLFATLYGEKGSMDITSGDIQIAAIKRSQRFLYWLGLSILSIFVASFLYVKTPFVRLARRRYEVIKVGEKFIQLLPPMLIGVVFQYFLLLYLHPEVFSFVKTIFGDLPGWIAVGGFIISIASTIHDLK